MVQSEKEVANQKDVAARFPAQRDLDHIYMENKTYTTPTVTTFLTTFILRINVWMDGWMILTNTYDFVLLYQQFHTMNFSNSPLNERFLFQLQRRGSTMSSSPLPSVGRLGQYEIKGLLLSFLHIVKTLSEGQWKTTYPHCTVINVFHQRWSFLFCPQTLWWPSGTKSALKTSWTSSVC